MAAEKRINLKAKTFQSYLDSNDLKFFQQNATHDEADTVVFQSNIQVEGQTLPVGIITDNTIYTIIRVQIGTGLVKEENKSKLNEYLNSLNRSYKVLNMWCQKTERYSLMLACPVLMKVLILKLFA